MIRILLAYPSRLICDTLRTTLDNVEDVYIVGCATTAEELYFLLPHGNLVLLGSELENATALEVLDKIRLTHPQIKVLVLGINDNPDTILKYIEAGAVGYVLQNESVEDITQKLRAAQEEKAIISPSVAAAMMERLVYMANLKLPVAFAEGRGLQLGELTSREEEVLQLIAHGFTNQEIANELIVECGTVKNHVHNILKKLDVNNRHEAATLFKMRQPLAVAA
jgi:DNA-binding NarL/FixJ family response regulator